MTKNCSLGYKRTVSPKAQGVLLRLTLCAEPYRAFAVDAMYGVDGAAARRRDRRLRQFLRHEQLSVKMHVAARGARVDAATQTMCFVDAATCAATASLAPVIEYVAAACAVTDSAPSPVIDYVAPVPAVIHATPATVIEHVAPKLADAYATPATVIEYATPAPTQHHRLWPNT